MFHKWINDVIYEYLNIESCNVKMSMSKQHDDTLAQPDECAMSSKPHCSVMKLSMSDTENHNACYMVLNREWFEVREKVSHYWTGLLIGCFTGIDPITVNIHWLRQICQQSVKGWSRCTHKTNTCTHALPSTGLNNLLFAYFEKLQC